MKKNILVVSDNKDELYYFTDAFKKIPGLFNYLYADSAEKGLTILKRLEVDLVFAQYKLSKTNGLVFLSAVKNYRRFWNLRVFLYSQCIREEESKMAQRLGASGCLEIIDDTTTFIRELKAILDPELLPNYVFFPKREETRFVIETGDPAGEMKLPANGVVPAEGARESVMHTREVEKISA